MRKKKGVPAVNLDGIYPIWSSWMKYIENFVFVVVTLIHPSAFTVKLGTLHDGHEHFPASVSMQTHLNPSLAVDFSWEGYYLYLVDELRNTQQAEFLISK
jgi:hypothetical protein